MHPCTPGSSGRTKDGNQCRNRPSGCSLLELQMNSGTWSENLTVPSETREMNESGCRHRGVSSRIRRPSMIFRGGEMVIFRGGEMVSSIHQRGLGGICGTGIIL